MPELPVPSRHNRQVLVLVLTTMLVSGLGLGASRWVRSPEQALADTRGPGPTRLTAPVEKRVLKDTVILRGTVGAEHTYRIEPALAADQARAVVSGVRVRAGNRLRNGQVVVEVSGRPVVVLKGRVPAYRDLRPGDTGRDVTQLQKALRALDLGTGGDRDGVLGPGTKTALEQLYRRIGYSAPQEGDPGELASARQQVRQARRTLTQAQDAAAGATGSDVTAARREVRYAREDLADAISARSGLEARSGAKLPMSEVAFLPRFPARVESVKARTGKDAEGTLLTVSSGDLVVRGRVNAGQRELLREDMPVRLDSEVLGTGADGVVDTIGPEREQEGTRGHDVLVRAADEPFGKELAGEDVRLTVETAATEGEVLVVPSSAVVAGAGGDLAVLRVAGDDEERVPVEAGVSGNGYVEVRPLAGHSLAADDLVVVGTSRREP